MRTRLIPIDNFSTHRKYAKGFISSRVDDPDKMRDYETLRGYFSKNAVNYIFNRIRHCAIQISYSYGRERKVLRALLYKKVRRVTAFPGALVLGLSILYLELVTYILRTLSLILPAGGKGPNKSMLLDGYDYIFFDSEELMDINVKDIWRPTIVSAAGKTIKGRIKKNGKSEVRIGFALLENADPKIFSGDYSVEISYLLRSEERSASDKFCVPIHHENDNMEHNNHSLWLDFKIGLDEFRDGDIELALMADYRSDSEIGPAADVVKNRAIAWSAPRVIKNKSARSTKKILVISLETFTDPKFISASHGVRTDHLFGFLNDREWKQSQRAYAQSDGTLGSAGSFVTGLTPLQHGLFDYGLPFYTRYSKALSGKLMTLAQLLKTRGFSTHSIGLKAFSGYAGCARGFDSHFACYNLHELDCADLDWLSQTMEGVIENDGFIFMHFDRLHKPYVKWHRRLNKVYGIEELTTKDADPLERYVRQMNELDIQLKKIINCLKFMNQYENTLIICIGDHGGAYAWKKRQAYDLYEDRIRVPLWVKRADWSDWLGLDAEKPTNATIFSFLALLKLLDIPLPEYFRKLAQSRADFEGIAISETATAPKEDDYVLSLTDETHKYIRFVRVDWARNIILHTERELLQPYKYASTNYGLDMNCSDAEPDKFKHFRKLADMHIESSFEFRRRYPMEA